MCARPSHRSTDSRYSARVRTDRRAHVRIDRHHALRALTLEHRFEHDATGRHEQCHRTGVYGRHGRVERHRQIVGNPLPVSCVAKIEAVARAAVIAEVDDRHRTLLRGGDHVTNVNTIADKPLAQARTEGIGGDSREHRSRRTESGQCNRCICWRSPGQCSPHLAIDVHEIDEGLPAHQNHRRPPREDS